jgi:hypothetical protein
MDSAGKSRAFAFKVRAALLHALLLYCMLY